jgi:H+-translocating NAD(P) transhydrogenase subunit alpha
MIVAVLKEPFFESRVSLLPEATAELVKKGHRVLVEKGAGELTFISDEQYQNSRGEIMNRQEIIRLCDIVLTLHPENIPKDLRQKAIIGIYQPLFNVTIMQDWASRELTVFSLDMLPRSTRAQSMDVLSSQANIAGYKAVLVAANLFPRYFPMFMTAAGSVPPAKVLILGAGVAGLQAIATARRLGAVVEVFDTRPAVKEEVLSLGGKFIEVEGAVDSSTAGGYAVEQSTSFLQHQQAKIAESIAKADIVITTAQIPGKPAPRLVTKAMVEQMKSGSVIVDLAASSGGNTELTKDKETVIFHGVRIVGNSALASEVPMDASKLYGKNLINFLQLITGKTGDLELNFEDDLVKGCCITHAGIVQQERVRMLLVG